MLRKPLVSILIPCYNGMKTLSRCMDSILNQTYSNIEVVIVNDGSTDNSEEIILEYVKIFEMCKKKIIYVKQENQGLGGAINTALKYFTGDFLCWGDCDDFWLPKSIEYRVEFLENHLEYGCVSSDAYVFDENDLENPIGYASDSAKDVNNPHQFMNHLIGVPLFCSGTHMVRTSAFLQANPKCSIYPARYGQNNQLLMPVYYHYKHAFVKEPLYGYVVYSNSMSHQRISVEQIFERNEEYCDTLKYTVMQIVMADGEKKKYLSIIEGRRCRNRWDYGLEVHSYSIVIKSVLNLIMSGQFNKCDMKRVCQLIKNRIGKINGI